MDATPNQRTRRWFASRGELRPTFGELKIATIAIFG
jgi:hypothetical protein